MMRTRSRVPSIAAVIILVGVTVACVLPASAAVAARPYDFNGDGFADLAVGVPGEDLASIRDAGGVNVIYGSAAGLTATGNQFWSQDNPDVPGGGEPGDRFGTPASGDFNGDGFADLAVGVPGEAIGTLSAAGAVNVFYGSRRGLRGTGSRFFSQATSGVPGAAERGDGFGTALTAGDFNGDLSTDLAIAAPGEDIGPTPNNRGSVTVLFGGPAGLGATSAQAWNAELLGFGLEGGLATEMDSGDVTGDGRDDLVVLGAQAVYFLRGGPTGLTADGAQRWTPMNSGIADVMATPGWFTSVTLGDFDADRRLDLAAGSPRADVTDGETGRCGLTKSCIGAVVVLPGTASGLTTAGHQLWHRHVPGVPAPVNAFGRLLAAGDLDGDGDDDLVAAQGDDDTGGGRVGVLYGSPQAGLSTAGSQVWAQELGVSGANEEEDGFASALQVAQFGRSRHADLAMGVRYEGIGTIRAGRVAVLYGSAGRLTATGQQSWSQDPPDVRGTSESGDWFGALGR